MESFCAAAGKASGSGGMLSLAMVSSGRLILPEGRAAVALGPRSSMVMVLGGTALPPDRVSEWVVTLPVPEPDVAGFSSGLSGVVAGCVGGGEAVTVPGSSAG